MTAKLYPVGTRLKAQKPILLDDMNGQSHTFEPGQDCYVSDHVVDDDGYFDQYCVIVAGTTCWGFWNSEELRQCFEITPPDELQTQLLGLLRRLVDPD
jgi:hypothetical protein